MEAGGWDRLLGFLAGSARRGKVRLGVIYKGLSAGLVQGIKYS